MQRWFIKLFFLITFLGADTTASPPTIQQTFIPEYDYTQTRLMVLYGEEDYVLLGNPFEHPAPSMGGLVYEIILLYVPQLQPFKMPSEQPTHVLDLMMRDRHDRWRLGQRLYIGDPWISDGKSLALMMPADYKLLSRFLSRRYKKANRLDVGRIKNVQRPTEETLPEDWLLERDSMSEAIQRLPASDYEPAGYDPGAKIRRKRIRDQRKTAVNTDTGASGSGSAELKMEKLPEVTSSEFSSPNFTSEDVSNIEASGISFAPFDVSAVESEVEPNETSPHVPSSENSRPSSNTRFFLPAVFLMGLIMAGSWAAYKKSIK